MTTYSYKCDECLYEFDAKQRMTDDSLKICPECNNVALRRVITTTSKPIFKGGGWPDKKGY